MASSRAYPLASVVRAAVRAQSSPMALPAAPRGFGRAMPPLALRYASPRRLYSTTLESDAAKKSEAGSAKEPTSGPQAEASKSDVDASIAELERQLEERNKTIAELKDARLRAVADYDNLQKITAREKTQAKDFALTAFARDLISSIDILALALKSIPEHKIVAGHKDAPPDSTPNPDLVQLHEGLNLTKKEIERVLKRHGVVAFDPTGEAFDPNRHEALYQAPVPGKEPGTVLETQEIGYMIKDRLLRPAKVGVVLAQ